LGRTSARTPAGSPRGEAACASSLAATCGTFAPSNHAVCWSRGPRRRACVRLCEHAERTQAVQTATASAGLVLRVLPARRARADARGTHSSAEARIYPHSPFGHVALLGGHKRTQTFNGLPNHLAAPRDGAPLGTKPNVCTVYTIPSCHTSLLVMYSTSKPRCRSGTQIKTKLETGVVVSVTAS
jgi:hypothetical protein